MTTSDDQTARRVIAYAQERLAQLAEVRERFEHAEDRELYDQMKDFLERAVEDPYLFAREVKVGPDGKGILRL